MVTAITVTIAGTGYTSLTDGRDRPPDRDGDSDGDDQQWHGWRWWRRWQWWQWHGRHGLRVRHRKRRLRLHERADGHDLGRWRQRRDGQRHRNEWRGHRDHHHERWQWLYLGSDGYDRDTCGRSDDLGSRFATPNSYQFAATQKDGAGNISPLSPSVTIQIVTTGTVPTLRSTRVRIRERRATASPMSTAQAAVFPQFDVGNVVPGATLTLLRNGVVVNTLSNAAGGTAVIGDQGGVIPDGIYQYTVQQLDNVGNTATSAPVTVQIVSSAAAPATPVLQAASDTGALGDNTTSVRNPQFNVSGVPAGATVSLLRGGVVVSTVLSPGGGTVAIGDPGPLTNGRYTYTASLVDGAGNQSPPSGSLTISLVTVQGDYTGAGLCRPGGLRSRQPERARHVHRRGHHPARRLERPSARAPSISRSRATSTATARPT